MTYNPVFPSPRGVELHKPAIFEQVNTIQSGFPSPRGVELHKPCPYRIVMTLRTFNCFRPLAGLSCINLKKLSEERNLLFGFRPLAGLSCINLNQMKGVSL